MNFATFAPLLDALVQLAVVFVLALSPVLVRAGIRYLEKRLAIDFADKQEQQVQDLVARGVAYAEESARKHLAAGEPKPDKLAKAIAFIVAEAERLGIRHLAQTQAEHLADMVEAKLGLTRP